MSDTIHNQISAFVDGELPEHEAELLVRRLCSNQELREVAARYGLVGDLMRGELSRSSSRVADRVMARVNKEPQAASPRVENIMRPVAGLALAATVAGLALFGLQSFQPEQEPLVSIEIIAPDVVENSEQLSSDLRRRLNLKQVSHNLYRTEHLNRLGGLAHLNTVELTMADTIDEKKDKNQDRNEPKNNRDNDSE